MTDDLKTGEFLLAHRAEMAYLTAVTAFVQRSRLSATAARP
jgi:hypothetical protein